MAPDSAERSLAVVLRFMNASGAERRTERSSLLRYDVVVKAAGGLSFSGDYHGKEGFFDLLTKMNELVELTPGPITADPLGENAVAARFRLTFTARSSRNSVEVDVVELYTVRDGQIVELDVYYKDPSAVAALLVQ
jgi:ketosteroid isomerase-like protein